jgi:hypothetical protein
MRVIANLEHNNPDDPDHYMKFDEMGDDSEDNILFAHWGSIINPAYREQYQHFKRKVSWWGGDPCCFMTGRQEDIHYSADLDDYFTKSFIICPYTAKWLNEHWGKEKFELAIIPHNANEVPDKEYEKEHDVIYWGGIHNRDHMKILDIIGDFNSNFYTIHPAHWNAYHEGLMDRTQANKYLEQLTGILSPRREIWETLRKTKVFIMTNTLPFNEKHRDNVKKLPNWQKNEAFSHIDQLIAPQMKTRPVEAAFNKTLNLVKKDPWNVIEHWFKPDEDFIYFDNYEDVPKILRSIINDWDDYLPIVESAYNKAINNLSSQKLFEKMSGE